MKIAIAQMEVSRGEPEVNLEILGVMVAEAAGLGARSVHFPEMCTTGFDWRVNRALLPEARSLLERVRELARRHGVAITGSFLERTEQGQAANTLYFIEADGRVAAKYRKVHLFTLFREERHVEPGAELVTAATSLGMVGCSVCYDLRFPELFRGCALAGAELQLLPAAFPHPRLGHWQTLVRARAIENQCYFVAVNQCGVEAHAGDVGDICYFGHSMVVDPWGEVLYEADERAGVQVVEIDPALVGKVRARLLSLRDRRADVYLK